MERAKVYFTSFHTKMRESIQEKLTRLLLTAGLDKLPLKNKYVAIKLHFGEPGNLAYLRPNYARTVADLVKRLGGKPFLTDCNTLYVGGRRNALDHLEAAYQNGFNPYNLGCHLLIADGLKGTDDVEVPVDGDYIKTAKIGRAIMDADIVISLSHFKGHESAGFGGAIKNLGMGCGSCAGKMEMHYAGKPFVKQELCVGCGSCRQACAYGAPNLRDGKMCIDKGKCVGCGRCLGVCPVGAIKIANRESSRILNRKMAEYAKAVLQGRPGFHISLARDISAFCDCYSVNEMPVIPDVGMFASSDPVAIDKACVDACNKMERRSNADFPYDSPDLFTALHGETYWREQIDHGKKIGLGTDEYDLIEI